MMLDENVCAKPFVKWVGGKSQLIGQLEALLPVNFDKKENVTYIEPFVGGGAMLFHMLQTHGNIKHAIINVINPDLRPAIKLFVTNLMNLYVRLSLFKKIIIKSRLKTQKRIPTVPIK